MNAHSPLHVSWPVAIAGAIVLLVAGAGAMYLVMRPGATPAAPSSSAVVQAPPAAGNPEPAPADVAVTLSEEAIERAGIVVAPVTAGVAAGSALTAPGVVEPNAYKTVVVTPLVSGRITRVAAELGDHVRQGQTLAQVFSPELADAQTRYIAEQAQLDAHEQELARTETLVRIGAASREELERIHAEHAARRAQVQAARSRLQLLGLSAKTIEALGPGSALDSLTNVPAPISGVVTERDANVGLNVDQATKLFAVVDLSSVWVVAEVYEKDFSRVRVGTPATVTTPAYPDLVLKGRVSYIDPQVDADTRTVKARIEVPNPGQTLRLGMFATASFDGEAGQPLPMVPRSAVQNVGDRTVVYLADPREPGRLVEREVTVGRVAGEQVPIVSGVAVGDTVVVSGSFHVRAEIERLGLRRSAAPSDTSSASPQDTPATGVQEATVVVGEAGFEPASLTLRAGVPARVTFLRTTDTTCATEVVFPSLELKRALPLNEPVVVAFTPPASGEIAFACGMNMIKGSVVVR